MNKTFKKLLVFVPEFPVLSETFIQREIVKLVERNKLDVTILSLRRGSGDVAVILRDRTVYRKLKLSDLVFSMSMLFKDLGKAFELFKIILNNKNRNILQNIYLFIKSIGYAKVFKDYAPDHIHVHFLSEPSTIVMLASQIISVPFSVSGHARDVFGSSKDIRLNSELIDKKLIYSKFITLCNKKAYSYCLSVANNATKGKLFLFYHGLDIDVVENLLSSKQKTKNSVPKILCVGRLEEKKGLIYLIDAGAILKTHNIPFEINIIGPGPLYKELQEAINVKGLSQEVKILGEGRGLQNQEVFDEMQKADVFVLPSIETAENDTEGIPNTIIEATVFSLPIITTKTGSIEELVLHEHSGILVNQRDSEALAKAIMNLLSDDNLRLSIVAKAKAIVIEKFNLNSNIIGLEELILR